MRILHALMEIAVKFCSQPAFTVNVSVKVKLWSKIN